MTRPTFNPAARRRARRYALQALYQWTMTGDDLAIIENQFCIDNDFTNVDFAFFQAIVRGVSAYLDELEAAFTPYLDRDISKLGTIERNILRLGVFELTYRSDIPYTVSICEAVKLAKTFAATDSHKYINAVLDRFAYSLQEA